MVNPLDHTHDRDEESNKFSHADVRDLLGFLSGYIPELHRVEIPRLATAFEKWLELRRS